MTRSGHGTAALAPSAYGDVWFESRPTTGKVGLGSPPLQRTIVPGGRAGSTPALPTGRGSSGPVRASSSFGSAGRSQVQILPSASRPCSPKAPLCGGTVQIRGGAPPKIAGRIRSTLGSVEAQRSKYWFGHQEHIVCPVVVQIHARPKRKMPRAGSLLLAGAGGAYLSDAILSGSGTTPTCASVDRKPLCWRIDHSFDGSVKVEERLQRYAEQEPKYTKQTSKSTQICNSSSAVRAAALRKLRPSEVRLLPVAFFLDSGTAPQYSAIIKLKLKTPPKEHHYG